MKRSAIALMLLLVFTTVLNGCIDDDDSSNTKINTIGNNSNNIIDRGLVAEQGDWIYFYDTGRSFGIGEGLYRSKADGSKRKKIVSGTINSSINVLGDWIYYVGADRGDSFNAPKKYNLYKIKTDGTSKSKILENCYYVNILDDKIYYDIYVDEIGYRKIGIEDYPLKNELGNVYSMKLDGSEKTKLISKKADSYVVINDAIIYSTNTGIYKITIDGRNEQKLSSVEYATYKVNKNRVFNMIRDLGNNQTRLNILDLDSNTTNEIIIQDRISEFNICNNKLYLISDNLTLFQMDTNGSSNIKEIAKGVHSIYTFENNVYSWNGNQVKKLN